MRQPAPAHVGDVQQAVQPAQVDERAVVGQILHRPGQDAALFQGGECDCLLRVLLLFEDLLAADHDVAALLVQLDDPNFNLGADIAVEVAHRAHLNLRARQERLDADVDGQASFDSADHQALHWDLVIRGLLQLVPYLVPERLLVADQVAAFRLLALHNHVDRVAGLELGIALEIQHLLNGDQSLGLQSDVDHHMLVGDFDHGSRDDDLFDRQVLGRGRLGSLFAVKVCQSCGKICGVVVRLGGRRRSAGDCSRAGRVTAGRGGDVKRASGVVGGRTR